VVSHRAASPPREVIKVATKLVLIRDFCTHNVCGSDFRSLMLPLFLPLYFLYDAIFLFSFLCVTRSSTHLITTPCPFPRLSPLSQHSSRFVLGSFLSLGYIHNLGLYY
jgi:hypothetical protein